MLKLFQKACRKIWRNKKGQTTAEYVLIVAVIVVASIVALYAFRNQLVGAFIKVMQTIGVAVDRGVEESGVK